MGTGIGTGDDKSKRAASEAISSPLLEDVSISGAKGLLVNITAGPSLSQDDISEVMETINGAAGEESDTYFGVVLDETMPEDEVRITLIATGFESDSGDNTEEPPARTIPDRIERVESTERVEQQPAQKEEIRSIRPIQKPTNDLSVPAFQRRAQAVQEEEPEAKKESEQTAQEPVPVASASTEDIRVPTFIRKSRRNR